MSDLRAKDLQMSHKTCLIYIGRKTWVPYMGLDSKGATPGREERYGIGRNLSGEVC